MKRLLDAYAKYNSWANRRLANILMDVDSGLLEKQIDSSFPSLLKTVRHMHGAEVLWYERLRRQSLPAFPEPNPQHSPIEEIQAWADFSDAFRDFVIGKDEAFASRNIMFQTTRGTKFTQSAATILMHIYNHSTYHRGQLVTICRQLGISDLPATDFIAYCRA